MAACIGVAAEDQLLAASMSLTTTTCTQTHSSVHARSTGQRGLLKIKLGGVCLLHLHADSVSMSLQNVTAFKVKPAYKFCCMSQTTE